MLNCITIPAPPADTPEWHALRQQHIGGSDCAVALGLSKWSTPYELWLEKRGLGTPKRETRAMRLGKRMEDIIADEYRMETGNTIAPFSMYCKHPKYSFMGANPDRLIYQGDNPVRGLEIKRSDMPDAWGESGSDEYPDDYFMQCQHYMCVTGLPAWDLCVLLPRNDLRIYTLEADAALHEKLIELESQFWLMVEQGIEPQIDYSSPGALEAVKTRYSLVGTKTVTLPEECLKLVQARQQYKAMITESKKNIDAIEARLIAEMRDASVGMIDGSPVVIERKEIQRKAYEVQATSYLQLKVKGLKKDGE
jgi:putative phage-type endonuclease